VDLRFNDQLSTVSVVVSQVAWRVWLGSLALMLLLLKLEASLAPAGLAVKQASEAEL
jgi:hypothetical protein